jgi:hypothetical protein
VIQRVIQNVIQRVIQNVIQRVIQNVRGKRDAGVAPTPRGTADFVRGARRADSVEDVLGPPSATTVFDYSRRQQA